MINEAIVYIRQMAYHDRKCIGLGLGDDYPKALPQGTEHHDVGGLIPWVRIWHLRYKNNLSLKTEFIHLGPHALRVVRLDVRPYEKQLCGRDPVTCSRQTGPF